jgi:ribosome-associated protein
MSKKMNSQKIEFPIDEEYIELIKLLKATQVAQTGGHAKMLVEDGLVRVNGVLEERKRAKIRKGFTVEIDDLIIQIS